MLPFEILTHTLTDSKRINLRRCANAQNATSVPQCSKKVIFFVQAQKRL